MAVPAVMTSPGSAARVTMVPRKWCADDKVLAIGFGFRELEAGLFRARGTAGDLSLLLNQLCLTDTGDLSLANLRVCKIRALPS